MTEKLKTILDEVDKIENDDTWVVEEYEAITDYCNDYRFIIPQEDWEEIEARGYDLTEQRNNYDSQYDFEDCQFVWDSLSEVPIDNKDNITEFWRGYPKGTCRFEIWSDIETYFGVSIAIDLMHLPESEV